MSICSARPNFIKLASIFHAAKAQPTIQHYIVHTGQHYDPLFSDVFFEQLSIEKPTENLGINTGDRATVIQATSDAMIPVLHKYKPDWVLVYGDVNGAVGAARAAQTLGIPIAHIEAGLRSNDLSMPEENNRIEIDTMASVLFCSEQSGIKNLQQEKLGGVIEFVGNTMIDTLYRMLPEIVNQPRINTLPESYVVVTLHRPSNVDTKSKLVENMQFLNEIAAKYPIVLPMHHRLKSSLNTFGITNMLDKNIHIIDPLGYTQFIRLILDSIGIITDSGGIQEEATYLQKQCFTLRENTERPATIDSGCNILIDPINNGADTKKVLEYLQSPHKCNSSIPLLWDGHAGERIISWFLQNNA